MCRLAQLFTGCANWPAPRREALRHSACPAAVVGAIRAHPKAPRMLEWAFSMCVAMPDRLEPAGWLGRCPAKLISSDSCIAPTLIRF